MSLFKKGAVMEKAAEGMADQLEQALRDSLPDDLTPEQVAALDPSRFEMAEYDDTLAEKTGYSSYFYWRSTFRAFWNNRLARFLLVALLLLIAFTIIQPHLPGPAVTKVTFVNHLYSKACVLSNVYCIIC